MALVESRFRTLYGTLFAIFILFGISMTIIGATLPKILVDFSWSYATAGLVLGAGAVGYFLATYAAGFMVSSIGPRMTMVVGLSLVITGLIFFASVPSPLVNFLLSFGIGVGQGCIELTVNWSTLRMEKSGSGRAMNLMHGAFAAGAFAGPFFIGLLIGANLSWTLIYRGMAVLLVGILAVMLGMPFSALGRDAGHTTTGSRKALYSHPAYWLGFIALLVYVGVELGVSNWIAEYFVTTFKTGAAVGSFMVSLFWGGLLLGRFGIPMLYRGKRSDTVLLLMSILMSASIVMLTVIGFIGNGSTARTLSAVFAVLSGLGCSIVYPMVVTMIGSIFPHAQSEAVAFAGTGGGIGAFVFPFLMANIATAWGIRAGFATYAVFSVLAVFLNVVLIRISKRV
jgi:fucose permease